MSRLRVVGLALAVVFAMSSVGVASASGHEFIASAKGAKLSGTVIAGIKGVQKFTTAAGIVECNKLEVTEGVTEGVENKETKKFESPTQNVTIQYKGCSAFGFVEVVVTPAKYTFSAEVGTGSTKNVTLNNEITITVASCTVNIPGKQTIGEAKYSNSTGKIELEPNVSGITSSGSGFGCEYSSESKGKYTGNSTVEIPSPGTLEWK
jgi:hypothetical protein